MWEYEVVAQDWAIKTNKEGWFEVGNDDSGYWAEDEDSYKSQEEYLEHIKTHHAYIKIKKIINRPLENK